MSVEHLVLAGGNTFAGFDDCLTARDAHADGLHGTNSFGFALLGGGAVEDDVGRHAVAEKAKEGLG